MLKSRFLIILLTLVEIFSFYMKGLQEFEFEHNYDVIWVQWVLCYLTDEDLMIFLKKCKDHLVDHAKSMIFIKENVHDTGFYVDKEDNSVVRSDKLFEALFERAGFSVVKHIYQPGFPKDLYRISLYALVVSK